MEHPPIATAADFQRQAAERRLANAETLALPSGLVIRVHRPSPEWWLRHIGRLPQTMAARVNGTSAVAPTPEELIEFSRWTVRLMEELVIEPRIRSNPQDGEVDPHWISDPDLMFLVRYAGGEVAADASDLDAFPGQRQSVAATSPGRDAMERAAERTG